MWRINLDKAISGKADWEDITSQTKNLPPYSFSHHCAVAYKSKIYFYGGTRFYSGPVNKFVVGFRKKKMEVPESVNIIDLKTLTWSMGPSITQARDDFASAFDEQTGRLYIFGGFNQS